MIFRFFHLILFIILYLLHDEKIRILGAIRIKLFRLITPDQFNNYVIHKYLS